MMHFPLAMPQRHCLGLVAGTFIRSALLLLVLSSCLSRNSATATPISTATDGASPPRWPSGDVSGGGDADAEEGAYRTAVIAVRNLSYGVAQPLAWPTFRVALVSPPNQRRRRRRSWDDAHRGGTEGKQQQKGSDTAEVLRASALLSLAAEASATLTADGGEGNKNTAEEEEGREEVVWIAVASVTPSCCSNDAAATHVPMFAVSEHLLASDGAPFDLLSIARDGEPPSVSVVDGGASHRHRHHQLMGDHVARHPEDFIVLRVPEAADTVTLRRLMVRRRGGSDVLDVRQLTQTSQPLSLKEGRGDNEQRRPFGATQTTAAPAISVRTLQLIDTATQPTITFLAAGYQANEQSTFTADVDRALQALRLASTATSALASTVPLDPSPWPRYLPLMNLFSVFQASADSGASVVVGPGQQCDSVVSSACPLTQDLRNNNLDCAFGTPLPRRLNCDYPSVLSLASNAPPADLIVVLVNDARYGGTGGGGIAVLSTGTEMPFLLLHETGHALGRLGDEYTYGVTTAGTSPVPSMPNCALLQPTTAVAPSLTNLPWYRWIVARQVDTQPQSGCSFDDMVRPTADSCVMREANPSLCPVCREAMTLAMLRKRPLDGATGAAQQLTALSGGSGSGILIPATTAAPNSAAMAAGGQVDPSIVVALDTPRCPPLGFEVAMGQDDVTTLSANHRFTVLNSNVTLTWVLPSNQTIPALPTVVVRASDLPIGSSTVFAVVQDGSPDVLPANRPSFMTYKGPYLFRVYPTRTANCSSRISCISSTGANYSYCGTCLRQGGCAASWTATPVQYLPPSLVSLAQAKKVVEIVAVVLAVVGVVIVVFTIASILTLRKAQPQLRPLLVLHEPQENRLVIAAGIASTITFALSLAVIGVTAVAFPTIASTVGPDVCIGGLVIAAFVYLTAGFAICSAASRGICGLCFTAFILLLDALAFATLGAFIFYIVVHSGDANVIAWYRQEWYAALNSNPQRVCQVQQLLQCSGFDAACMPVANGGCPANCDFANRNTNPCLAAWTTLVTSNMTPITIVICVAAVILFINFILCLCAGLKIRKCQRTARGRRSYRRDKRAPVAALSPEEVELVRRAFHAADKDGSGTLQADELRVFIRNVLGADITPVDEELITLAYAKRQQQYDDIHGAKELRNPVVDDEHEFYLRRSDARSQGRPPSASTTPTRARRAEGDLLGEGDGAFHSPVPPAASAAGGGGSELLFHDNPSAHRTTPHTHYASATATYSDGGHGVATPPHSPPPPLTAPGDAPPVVVAAYGQPGYRVGLSFDDCLAIFFPFVSAREADPRLLSEDEAEGAASTKDLVRMQLAKMEAYQEAAGALSPFQLDALHRAYRQSGGGPSFLNLVREAAAKHATTVEAAMCRGLTFNELEGLRCAWCELHPDIGGALSDEEIEAFYSKTHEGARLMSREHFVRWKAALDVRHTGEIGFAEYCFPFSQRALLRIAKSDLARRGKEVVVGAGQRAELSREEVAMQFGDVIAEAAFLPFESMIRVERVLAVAEKARPRRVLD